MGVRAAGSASSSLWPIEESGRSSVVRGRGESPGDSTVRELRGGGSSPRGLRRCRYRPRAPERQGPEIAETGWGAGVKAGQGRNEQRGWRRGSGLASEGRPRDGADGPRRRTAWSGKRNQGKDAAEGSGPGTGHSCLRGFWIKPIGRPGAGHRGRGRLSDMRDPESAVSVQDNHLLGGGRANWGPRARPSEGLCSHPVRMQPPQGRAGRGRVVAEITWSAKPKLHTLAFTGEGCWSPSRPLPRGTRGSLAH